MQWIGVAVAALAIAATLLPWHEVRDSGFGEGLACAFIIDCHMTPPSREDLLARPPKAVHTGLDHGGVFLIGLLALLIAARIASLRHPRPWLAALIGLRCLAVVVALALATVLMHMADLVLVTERSGWYLVIATSFALLAVGLADLASLAVVHRRHRESVTVPPP